MEKIPITKAGFEKLKKELEHLRMVAVPENIRDIEEARSHGDLTENAEYTAAKERQSYLHGRLQEVENNLALANVIDLKNVTGDKAVFGASVAIEDVKTAKEITYQLVGPLESDLAENKISVTSPIGRALIGKSIGDQVRVQTPGGVRELEIIDIFVEDRQA
ncbi:MAG: transcription elongation factor GreA [Deltaproteobacteria bacterium]|nr:transcription elongation factor GreA [Deltaproteobacteria bacterium]